MKNPNGLSRGNRQSMSPMLDCYCWFDSVKKGLLKRSLKVVLTVSVIALSLATLLGATQSWAYGFRVLNNGDSIVEESSDSASAEPIVWALDKVAFTLQFDADSAPSNTALLNETLTWNENALAAMGSWNDSGANFSWQSGSDQAAICEDSAASPDEVNSTGWSDDYCGLAWGSDVLAVTEVTYIVVSTGGENQAYIVDTNIILNSSERWDAYDGSVILTTGGNQPVFDFKRVVLHELGHALGLVHPDEVGQSLLAVMNSREDGTFELMADDLNGIKALYPATSAITSSSGNVSEQAVSDDESTEAEPESDIPNIGSSSGGGGAVDAFVGLLLIAYSVKCRGQSSASSVKGAESPRYLV